MTKRRRPRELSVFQQVLRAGAVFGIIALLLLSSLPQVLQNTTTVNTGPTPTLIDTSTAAQAFPTVPPGGTPIVVNGTFFHPTGLFSVVQVTGWDRPGEKPDETIIPSGNATLTRAGTTFINTSAASVIHTLVESDPQKPVSKLEDLKDFFNKENLDAAWALYKGGWTETGRRIDGDAYVIDFNLSHNNQTYMAQQLTKLNNGWMMTLRLVVPNNNPDLLSKLRAAVLPTFHLWTQALSAPLDWGTIADSGYMVRYPPAWNRIEGAPGRPYTLSGQSGADVITLSTRAYASTQLTGQDAAKAWLLKEHPKATIQGVTDEPRGDAIGYTLAYIDRDADGNQHSTITTVLNTPQTSLAALTMQLTTGDRNLLEGTNVPAEIAQIRKTFFALDTGTPAVSPTPTPAPAG